MARLAIFMDGGYIDALAEVEFGVRVDYKRLSDAIVDGVASKTPEPVDLLRTYYYHCLPYQSSPPTSDERARFSRMRSFLNALRRLERFTIREGRLAFRGMDSLGRPIFQQKRTDLLLGLDFALLSAKKQITHAAIVTGDSDLLPAMVVAQQEGIAAWLVHGPRVNSKGDSTYAEELWEAADERMELTLGLMNSVAR